MKKLLVFLALVGALDATYLTWEHFSNTIPPCTTAVVTLVDCGRVLDSVYATIFGIPLALLGLIHYLVLAGLLYLAIKEKKYARPLVILQTLVGLFMSIYLVWLQLFVIGAICVYCMVSAITSTALFWLTWKTYDKERKLLKILVGGVIYQEILKPLLFLVNAEKVHVLMVRFGETVGAISFMKTLVRAGIYKPQEALKQTVAGINFSSPIGLAAGFDYEARLTQSLEPWGFGFQTVGTITNSAYGGNQPPMLGRLPKSKSLMVNKGFKNPGAEEIIKKLSKKNFTIPVGISIGRTNRADLNQKQSVADVIAAFKKFEASEVKHSYYELNISCPNLHGEVEFYSPLHLEELLSTVDKLKLSRPVFVKMPIEKSEKEFVSILNVIVKHNIVGIVVGNLQKNRKHPSLDIEEVAKFEKGNFSGKSTFEDSNKFINLAYAKHGKRLIIIGCGGVFNGADAYTKIKNGATLIQMITGMIYQGPQVVAEIIFGLDELLKKDGYTHIGEAVGADVN